MILKIFKPLILFPRLDCREFADKFKAIGIDYEHRLIDDMVA